VTVRRDEFRGKIDELFPWEEEKKKKRPQRMDSIPSSTSLKAKVKSKTPMSGQEYLDLYLMIKEKERLQRFGETIGKLQLQTGKQWREMKKALKRAEKTLPSPDEIQGIVEDKEQETSPGKGEKVDKRKMPSGFKKVDWSF